MSRPNIAQLEQILASEDEVGLEILPDGEIRAKGHASWPEPDAGFDYEITW